MSTALFSEVIINRKLIKNIKYNKKSLFDIPIKTVKIGDGPEKKFILSLKSGMTDLEKKIVSFLLTITYFRIKWFRFKI